MKKLDISDITLYSSVFERISSTTKRGYGVIYVISNAHPTIKIVYLNSIKT